MTHPENGPGPTIEALAYEYQVLRCWIMNHVLDSEICTVEDWKELQEKAKAILRDTQR